MALTTAYLLVFPVPTRRELVVERHWGVDVASAPVVGGAADPAIPFSFPSVFGYLSRSGSVEYRGSVTHGVALSSAGFVSYGRTPDQLVLQNPDGTYRATVPFSGYPHFTGDRLVVSGAGGSSVSFSVGSDDRFVSRELPAILTSVQADGGLTVMGTLSGGIEVFGEDGEPLRVEGLAEPSSTVTCAVAVHAPSARVAAVYGPSDPALVVYRIRDSEVVPELRVDLSTGPAGPVALGFVNNGEQIIVHDGPVIRIVSTRDGAQETAPVLQTPRAIAGIREGLVLVLSRGSVADPQRAFRTPAEIMVSDASGTTPVRAGFAADVAFLFTLEDRPVLGVDGRVLHFSLELE